MAEPLAQQLERLQMEVRDLRAQLQAGASRNRDTSLVALIPKWTGTDKGVPLEEFLEAVEIVDRLGNWTEADMVQITILRLMDSARVFYEGNLDLHNKQITWADFRAIFQQRFRDVRTDQFHFTQLQMASQRKDESIQEFADKCRTLAYKTIPHVEDPVKREVYREQAERTLLVSFTAGLFGTPGKRARYAAPSDMMEALKIALSVEQAERLERRVAAFYVAPQVRRYCTCGPPQHGQGESGQSGELGSVEERGRPPPKDGAQTTTVQVCYGCGRQGHFLRDCLETKRRVILGIQKEKVNSSSQPGQQAAQDYQVVSLER
jgi:hypothetical protein